MTGWFRVAGLAAGGGGLSFARNLWWGTWGRTLPHSTVQGMLIFGEKLFQECTLQIRRSYDETHPMPGVRTATSWVGLVMHEVHDASHRRVDGVVGVYICHTMLNGHDLMRDCRKQPADVDIITNGQHYHNHQSSLISSPPPQKLDGKSHLLGR